ncbi:MAG: NADH-quinone oxidoreductase subunit E, partial [Pseudomonadota bacterium]
LTPWVKDAKTAPSPKAKPTTPKPKPAKAKPAKAAPKPVASAAEKQPEVLSAPRAGGADDLKKISGVGPKLEGVLNELGFYHFDQIAKWTADEIAWVDSRLKFKGRIERDNWMAQAAELAKAK